MRASRRFVKYICLLILVALSIQFSGYDCIADEESNNIDGIEAEYLQVSPSAATPGSDTNVPDPGNNSDEHLCPCHLTFTEPFTPDLTSFYEVTTLLTLPELLLTKNIPNSFFQPPKNIL